MSFDTNRLYDLLPAIYRLRDEREGGPLRELLAVMAEQIAVLEENLDQLYDDQFIETCADWVAPYIGALIGYRTLHGVAPKISSPRAEVAHTIAFRRRKGTAAMLEQLARDVTGWDANVVEYFLRLGWTQHMNHVRPAHAYAPSLRAWEPLERLGTSFDDLAHTVDVRPIATGDGRYNIPNIGIFLWRLGAHAVIRSPAAKVDDRRYRFSPLGNDAPLFTYPDPEDEISHLARPINVPAPISRRVLDAYRDDYYGEKKSILICRNGADVPAADIIACDLSGADGGPWAHRPQDKVAIDPVLGRIAFPEQQNPPTNVLVTFHFGFAHDMGGGAYDRRQSFAIDDGPLVTVSNLTGAPVTTIPAGLSALRTAIDALPADDPERGVVEIADSGRYDDPFAIVIGAGRQIELRAGDEERPLVLPGAELRIEGGANSEVTLNGLLLAGGGVRVPATTATGATNQLRALRLRHCTLVPRRGATGAGAPETGLPSLVVEAEHVTVEIDHCIVGGLRVAAGSHAVITNSIVDATSPADVAYAAPDDQAAGGMLQVIDTTIVGKVHTVTLEYASNVIFLAETAPGDGWAQAVRAERRQTGCVRFSFLDQTAAVPRRYRCQPDLEIATRIETRERTGPKLSAAQKEAIAADVTTWLVPRFTSLRYGDPGYGQLRVDTPQQIREGADDEAEMGAFHELYAPQRETNLRVRLDEYLRFGLEAGIFYAT